MTEIAIPLIICVVLVGGALAGALLRRVLPEHHLDTHAKDIVRLGCALLATICGLVLGLLTNSAKTNFDTQRDQFRQFTANLILLDHQYPHPAARGGCVGDRPHLLNLDCADVCAATGTVASRRTGSNQAVIKHMLEVCAEACRAHDTIMAKRPRAPRLRDTRGGLKKSARV